MSLPAGIPEFEARPPGLGSRLVHAIRQTFSPVTAEPDQAAPAWALQDVVYNRWQASHMLLGTVVALVFSGTWCGACQWETPSWIALHEKYARAGLRIVGVFMDYPADIKSFMTVNHVRYYCCAATEKIKWDFGVYPAGQIPLVALVDRKGILVGNWVHYHPLGFYEDLIKPLL